MQARRSDKPSRKATITTAVAASVRASGCRLNFRPGTEAPGITALVGWGIRFVATPGRLAAPAMNWNDSAGTSALTITEAIIRAVY